MLDTGEHREKLKELKINGSPLLKLSEHVLENIIIGSHLKRYHRKDNLYLKGDRAENVIYVVNGLVHLSVNCFDGSRMQFPRAYNGDWLGLKEILYDENKSYLTDAIAGNGTTTLRMDRNNFYKMRLSPGFRRMTDRAAAKYDKRLMEYHLNFMRADCMTKLIAYLLLESEAMNWEYNSEGRIIIQANQTDIGEATGMAREMVNRGIKVLKDADVVRKSKTRGGMEVDVVKLNKYSLDMDMLVERVQFESGYLSCFGKC